MKMMKSLAIEKYGGPEELKILDLPVPTCEDFDVLVEIHAAGLNPVDYKIRDGKLRKILPAQFPLKLGSELAGVVMQVGPKVTKFKTGDRVFGRVKKDRIGTFSECISAHESDLAFAPKTISLVEAAGIPLAGLTAYQVLFDIAKVEKGQKVLIHAGSGGVGSLAIQIAKILELEVATTTSTKNVELVKSLGADVVIDYQKEKFDEKLREYDLVFDTLGGMVLEQSFAVLKRGGRMISIAGPLSPEVAKDWKLGRVYQFLFWLMSRKAIRAAKARQGSYRYWFMVPSGKQLQILANWIDEGKLKPVVDGTYPLQDFKSAFERLESGRARGKIILTQK